MSSPKGSAPFCLSGYGAGHGPGLRDATLVNRADFLFVIGYDGDKAVVHGQQRRRFGKLDTAQLLEQGLFKPAFCSAEYSGKADELELVRMAMERIGGQPCSVEDLRKLFGVYGVPDNIKRVVVA
ncbi:MAG: hypothetical protein OXC12_07410 [Spirochaetaceae bacterium]|nr:hypothetical protein [Spirochaetaceae bacterium]